MLADRLSTAINHHDLDAFVACFHPDYASEQPVHPGRVFRGSDQVRRNWAAFFQEIPDITAELLTAAVDQEATELSEWHWHGTRLDGSQFDMRGVTIMGTAQGLIIWARLYMEPVDRSDEGIDEAVQTLTRR
ncbi:MAG TPA: nuclear transport factor 2 family protein [Mycobacterium sp.]|nr:nuclear transport factor 2 family protein [Mycobacterium sp.]